MKTARDMAIEIAPELADQFVGGRLPFKVLPAGVEIISTDFTTPEELEAYKAWEAKTLVKMADFIKGKRGINEPKVGRNDTCPCGSGKKHKKCCGR